MNDRLTIATQLAAAWLSSYRGNNEPHPAGTGGAELFAEEAVTLADALIAREAATRPAPTAKPGDPTRFAALEIRLADGQDGVYVSYHSVIQSKENPILSTVPALHAILEVLGDKAGNDSAKRLLTLAPAPPRRVLLGSDDVGTIWDACRLCLVSAPRNFPSFALTIAGDTVQKVEVAK